MSILSRSINIEDGSQKRKATSKRGASAKKGATMKRPFWMCTLVRDLLEVSQQVGAWVAGGYYWIRRYPAVLVLGIGCGLISVLWTMKDTWIKPFLDHPVTQVQVKGQLQFLNEEGLMKSLNEVLGQGFFSLDLYQLKSRIESNGWVEKASIRRVWPDTLEYVIVEQLPVARWNGQALLNPYGVIFKPESGEELREAGESLPHLEGEDSQAKEILRQYADLSKQMALLDVQIDALSLGRRGNWTVATSDGISIRLGGEYIHERLERVISVYRQLQLKGISSVEALDARYTNGVAVIWKKLDETGQQKQALLAQMP